MTVVMVRLAVWAPAAMAVVCAGCTAAPAGPHAAAPPGINHRPLAPATARHVVAGGCGGTSILAGSPPAWNAQPAGFTEQPPSLPYVVGGGDSVMGYLWARPLYTPVTLAQQQGPVVRALPARRHAVAPDRLSRD